MDKGRVKWIVGGVIVVIILLLLFRKQVAQATSPAYEFIVKQFTFTIPELDFNPPEGYSMNITIQPPAFTASSPCDCGCGGSEGTQAAYNDLLTGFANSLNDLQTDYTAALMEQIPGYLFQHLNNAGAYTASGVARGALQRS